MKKASAWVLALVLLLMTAAPAFAGTTIKHLPKLTKNGSVDFSAMTDEELATLQLLIADQIQSRSYSGAPASSSSKGGSATMGEKNALESAKGYLRFTSFSYSGLIDQLKYEGYSTKEATYGADHCGADWREQAKKAAENYLSFTSFSRSGLIKQLEYEGFTTSQAQYAVTQCGY